MKTMNEIITFLKERPAISLNQLEKDAGIWQGLLSKVLKGERKLPKKLLPALEKELTKYGYK